MAGLRVLRKTLNRRLMVLLKVTRAQLYARLELLAIRLRTFALRSTLLSARQA